MVAIADAVVITWRRFGHEHRGADVDVGVLGDAAEPDPDVLVERGRVEQPDPIAAEILREPRDSRLFGPGGSPMESFGIVMPRTLGSSERSGRGQPVGGSSARGVWGRPARTAAR